MGMEVQILKWTLVALMALGTLTFISSVGKPRDPVKPTDAVLSALINGGFIAWIIHAL